MNLVLPQVGTKGALTYLGYIWSQPGANVVYKLYKSDTTPAYDDTLADYTECNFPGYTPVAITAWNYSGVVLDGEGRAEITGSMNATFTFTGGTPLNSVYGYYVVDNSGGLLWAQRFDSAPITPSTGGDSITVVPRFTLRSQYGHP